MEKFNEILGEAKVNVNLDYTEMYETMCVKNRRLFVYQDIEDIVAHTLINDIMDINRMDKDIPVEERQPIVLYVTSNGGSVDDGFGIIDAIENSVTPIYTVNLAYQYSMGFLIGLAGKKRFSMPNAKFLMHDGSNCVWDSTAKVRDRLKFQEKTESRVKDYILSHSKLTPEQYGEKYRVEWYTYADEAKKYGFTDYIIGVDCDMSEVI